MTFLLNSFFFDTPAVVGITYDFTTGTLPAGVSLARDSNGTRFNASGVMEILGPDEPRFDHTLTGSFLGLLVEPQRTNLIRNSVGTGASLTNFPGNWGHALGSNTATYARALSSKFTGCYEVSVSYFNTATSGTSTANLRMEQSEIGVVLPDDEVTLSYAYSSHATNGFAGQSLAATHAWYDAADALMTVNQTAQANPGAWAIISSTRTAPAGVHSCQPRTEVLNVPAQQTSAYIMSAPQLEVGAFRTSYIPTNGSQATRAADILHFNLADGVYDMQIVTPSATYVTVVAVSGGLGWNFEWPPDAVDAGERHLRKVIIGDDSATAVAPTITGDTFSVSEAATIGTIVGSITFSGFPSPTLTITAGDATNKFDIDNNGQITVANLLDFETTSQYVLTVEAENIAGSATATVTINVTDAVEDTAPVINDQTFTVDDDVAVGTVIGTIVPAAGNPAPSYSMVGGEVSSSGTTVRVTSGGSIAGTLSASGQIIVAATTGRNGTVVTGKLTITGNDNIIYGLTWDATQQATAIEIRGKRNRIINCWFVGHRTGLSWQGCVDFASGSQDNSIEYCSFENIRHVNIRFVAPSINSRNKALYNHLYDTVGTADHYVGIQVGQSGDDHGDNESFTLVEGNLLERITAVEAIGIKSSRCTIKGNYLYLGSNINLRQGDDNIIEDNILHGANNACIVICDSNHIIRNNRVFGFGRVAPGEPVIAFSVGSRRTGGTTPTQWYAAKNVLVENNIVSSTNHAALFGWRNYAPEDFPGDHPTNNRIVGGEGHGQTRFDWTNAWSAGEEIPTNTGVTWFSTPLAPDPVPPPPPKPAPPANRPTVVNTSASGAVAAANSAPSGSTTQPAFAINATTGAIRTLLTLENTTNPTHTLIVTATNSVGSDTATITVNVTD